MSDNYLKLIPTSHAFTPSVDAMTNALDIVAKLCPRAQEVACSVQDGVMFHDCGSNLESISCAHCGASQMEWFFEETARKHEANKLQDIRIEMPCCSAASSLNDLRFEWPAGFASACIEALNPDRMWFTDAELEQVSKALGHPVKQILAHY